MLQAGKLGFRCSNLLRFSVVNHGSPKFNVPFNLSLTMSSKRRVVSSSAEGLESLTNADASKLHKKTPKEILRTSGGLEDEDIEKMTVQQIRSRLRSLGIPARGVKQELISTLKSAMNSHMDVGNSSALQGQVDSEEKPTVITYSRRKAERVSESESNYTTTTNITTGAKKSKRQALSTKDKEHVDSVETEGGKSTRTKRKVFSSVTTSDVVAHATSDVSIDEPWTVLTHKKPQKDWSAYNPKNMRPPLLTADTPNIKLMSWNVNGLRALLKLKSFSALQQRENFDVLCLQETKLQEKDVDVIRHTLLEGYDNCYWTCSVAKLGYSGTAIISRIKPLSMRYGLGIADHDSEGRLVTVEFDDFYLLNSYVPNSGDGLRRLSYRTTQWDTSLSDYMKDLERSKPVILTGDLNCAHQEIDIYNPAGNKRSAGFTIEERESFQKNFLDRGFVDTFRKQHPNVVAYTYWGYRHGGRKTNKGWRLDYFLASEQIADQVYDSYILPDVGGSDHSPIGLILKL